MDFCHALITNLFHRLLKLLYLEGKIYMECTQNLLYPSQLDHDNTDLQYHHFEHHLVRQQSPVKSQIKVLNYVLVCGTTIPHLFASITLLLKRTCSQNLGGHDQILTVMSMF